MTSSPGPSSGRHALTAVEKQRNQLERLLKDPSKPVYIPPPPKDKTIRPAREMMKNVQGSSAGAGSGEFHVYKASRRREYERLKIIEEATQKELVTAEFEQKRKEAEELANARTAKNRAKRQKKKERSKMKPSAGREGSESRIADEGHEPEPDVPFKKRRLVSGKELVFRQPGEESGSEEEESPEVGPGPMDASQTDTDAEQPLEAPQPTVELPKITIHDD